MMEITRNQIEALFGNFVGKQVMILGDVMVDAYLWGKVDRISPEAPVPVVSVKKRENLLGGAANVALNIKALGAVPLLCSIVGHDIKGEEFIGLLKQDGISPEGIIQSPDRITTTKFRIIGNKAQILRVDEEMDTDINQAEEEALLERIESIFSKKKIEVVILQDYNKGVLTRHVIEALLATASKLGIPVVVDPKKKNFEAYRNIDLFKPNLKELCEGLKIDIELNELDKVRQAVFEWQTMQSIKVVMVTLSEAGIFLRDTSGPAVLEYHIPAHLRNIADVSGAGDTVISVASLCRALNVPALLTASLSNLAGGLVCEHVGVVPVNRERLMKEAIELIAGD
jgi:rfaE bifunctional protein kinase chain/domain